MPVSGSVVGGEEPLWKCNGLPWEHFIESQCRGRRGRYRRANLGGSEGDSQTERLILWFVWNFP